MEKPDDKSFECFKFLNFIDYLTRLQEISEKNQQKSVRHLESIFYLGKLTCLNVKLYQSHLFILII